MGARRGGSGARPLAPGLLRFLTAGSVDDGKSTLIGRLMLDSKAILIDQLRAVERATRHGASGADTAGSPLNLALFTDGLRSEREQGITIDVAYRYFATARRKFIIADAPGHAEFTRNLVTAASRADLMLVLVDATRGLVEQTRRHLFVASLLRVPKLIVCVNKMDLVAFGEAAFEDVRRGLAAFAAKLELPQPQLIPISALRGDNVVEPSARMPWYPGPSLLSHLESVTPGPIGEGTVPRALRVPIQRVVPGPGGACAYQATIASGTMRVGDALVALPSRKRVTVRAIETLDGALEEAHAGQAVTFRLGGDLELGRGDALGAADAPPASTQTLEATLCWLDAKPFDPARRYGILHTTNACGCAVEAIHHVVDVNTLERKPVAPPIGMNAVVSLRLKTTQPIHCDAYRDNRATGAFILIDDATHATVGAGVIEAVE